MQIYHQKEIQQLIQEALKEDLGWGDITTQILIPAAKRIEAEVIAEEPAVVAGVGVAVGVFKKLDPKLRVRVFVEEGKKAKKGETVVRIQGSARAILSGERIALNFLSRLSGIATLTSHFVGKIEPLQTQILDTRKTTPGWRMLEKYAVRVGRGNNHRQGLYDQILVKENHVALLIKSKKGEENREELWEQLFQKIHLQNKKRLVIEVEVHLLKDLPYVLHHQPDWVLVDNFTPAQVKKAVHQRNQLAPSVLISASGGITLENVREYAQTGVDALAIGRLTHSARSMNFSLEIV